MGVAATIVPRLPRNLQQLFLYLIQRDAGAPGAAPTPAAVSSAAVGALVLDTITWGLPASTPGYAPDGFVVWWASGADPWPQDGGLKLSVSSRQFSMLWPSGAARSYAVAAYRNTYQGEQLGPSQQHDSWLGTSS